MLTPSIVRVTRKYRRRHLRRRQGIREVQVTGGHHLRDALDRGVGVMITPNHAAHYDSAALYLAADQLSTPLHFMTAWQVFAMSPPWEARLMQRLGCFSIDRESSDRAAFKQGVGILQHGQSPLVVFPEGDIYHITDRVTPFREGAAAIALSAARRSDREIAVVPCGIKFRYLEDPTRQLEKLMSQLEERLFMRPRIDLSLKERIYRFAESLLALKEIEYLGTTQSGLLVDRISCLSESILNEMGSRYAVRNGDRAVPDRVKELRQRIIVQLDEFKSSNPTVTSPAFLQLSRDMDALFFVLQLYSYPGDYLSGSPSVERVAETIDKFEEDVLQQDIPSVHARRRVEVSFGEPIVVPKQSNRGAAADLTKQTHAAVQLLIDQLCGEHSYREKLTQSVS